MFKKTLMAAALTAATASTAFAGDITISGTAYKVGNEYLGAYTGSALEGDLDAQAIGIAYDAGIALGVDNTLKFTFTGGAIEADTGLKLYARAANVTDHPNSAAILADAILALDDVTEAAPADTAADEAALEAAAIAVIEAAEAADRSVDGTAAIAAVTAVNYAVSFANTKTLVTTALATAIDSFTGGAGNEVADLVDFGVDANGDYEWVLFKLTAATLVTDTLFFNETDGGGDFGSNVTTMFTKATIGSGDLTVAMPEAKDGTGANLAAPVAAAKVLVTTADQFTVVTTTAKDTIDVEQDRLYFASGTGAVTTVDYDFDVTVNAVDLGINDATATFTTTIAGNLAGVESVDYVDGSNNAAFDADNEVTGTSILDATASVTVDGETNLATRDITIEMVVTPAEADTEDFVLVDAKTKAFTWDLNGSEITFPYAPIGYSHITTNFELANSGSQEGDILLTAFTREDDGTPVTFSGTLDQKATAQSLVKISEGDVYDALGLTEGTSISLTVTTTAPAGDVKVTGYSNLESGGRMTLLSDAYEGDKASCSGTIAGGNGTVTCD